MSEGPRKQIHHYDGQGDARELTFSCFQRQPYFNGPHAIQWFFKALRKARNELPIHVWAYVVMPEHVHLLVWPTEHKFKISRLLETIKTSVGKRAGNHRRRTNASSLREDEEFHFWQSGPGYDRNFDNDGTIWAGIDYIHRNPIRRNLCVRIEDWPWSSAGIYAGGSEPFPVDRESLPPDPRT